MSSGSNLRILIFTWRDLAHPLSGGAEVFTQRVAASLVRMGHHVTLFCAAVPGEPASDVVDGVFIERRGSKLGVYKEARTFYELEGRGKFDVVIDEVNTRPFLAPNFVDDAPVLALIFQVAREVWFHEVALPAATLGRFVLEPRWLRPYRNTPVITISESSKVSLERYGLRDVSVIPVGLDLPKLPEHPKKESGPTLMFVGRLAINKQPDHALSAFEKARRVHKNARLWIVGRGPLEEHLRRKASDAVTFHGSVTEQKKFELLGRAHALLVTSAREGWGMVVSEAAAIGTPSIAYDVPGLRDSVKASGGELVEPNVRAMKKALIKRIPQLTTEIDLRVQPGGVVPWDDVAQSVLEHAQKVVESARA